MQRAQTAICLLGAIRLHTHGMTIILLKERREIFLGEGHVELASLILAFH